MKIMIAWNKFIYHPIKCLSVGPQNKKCPYFKIYIRYCFFFYFLKTRFVTGPLCENYDSRVQSGTTPVTLEVEKVHIYNQFAISTKISSYFSYINSEAHSAKILKGLSRGPRNRKSPYSSRINDFEKCLIFGTFQSTDLLIFILEQNYGVYTSLFCASIPE